MIYVLGDLNTDFLKSDVHKSSSLNLLLQCVSGH